MSERCVLVLGHSGTEGFGLDSRNLAWPGLLEEHLAASGLSANVVAVPLFPVGARAVEYAMRKVEQYAPETVILSLNAYPCAVPVVSARVRRRLGNRAHGTFVRLEERMNRFARGGSGTMRKTAHSSLRKAAHRVVGAEPLATLGEVAEVYSSIMWALARREGIQLIALSEAPFSRKVRGEFPRSFSVAEELQNRLEPTVREHRFLNVSPKGFEGGGPDEFWMTDGVHLSTAGNLAYAESLFEPVRRALGATAD